MDTHVDTGKGDPALTLLADLLGAEVVAIGPVDSPLPVTGHCSRCGSSATVYRPAERPLCDRCRGGGASRPANAGPRL